VVKVAAALVALVVLVVLVKVVLVVALVVLVVLVKVVLVVALVVSVVLVVRVVEALVVKAAGLWVEAHPACLRQVDITMARDLLVFENKEESDRQTFSSTLIDIVSFIKESLGAKPLCIIARANVGI
jgi:hypothetical protein